MCEKEKCTEWCVSCRYFVECGDTPVGLCNLRTFHVRREHYCSDYESAISVPQKSVLERMQACLDAPNQIEAFAKFQQEFKTTEEQVGAIIEYMRSLPDLQAIHLFAVALSEMDKYD